MPYSNLITTYLGAGALSGRPASPNVPGIALYWSTDSGGSLGVWNGTTWVSGYSISTLTFGTHLTSGAASFDGSTPATISTDATNVNAPSTIVARDASGNFSAGTITAALTGTASNASTLLTKTWAAPDAIGTGTAAAGTFTALVGTTINGNTISTGTGTLTLAASSTLVTVGAYSLTLTSTAATNSTLPAGTHTLAALDVAQTWTAAQNISPPEVSYSADHVILASELGKLLYMDASGGNKKFVIPRTLIGICLLVRDPGDASGNRIDLFDCVSPSNTTAVNQIDGFSTPNNLGQIPSMRVFVNGARVISLK